MKRFKMAHAIGWTLAFCWLFLGFLPSVKAWFEWPQVIEISRGQEANLPLGWFFDTRVEDASCAEVMTTDAQRFVSAGTLHIRPKTQGKTTIKLNLFGVTVRQVTLLVTSPHQVIPGGDCIGITLHTKGVLVVGLADVSAKNGVWRCPAGDAGILPGDEIISIDGVELSSAKQFSESLSQQKSSIILRLLRGNKLMQLTVMPEWDANNKQMLLGMWVRDSMAGVGTLTFIDPQNQVYAALGHAINDPDTGGLFSVRSGKTTYARVLDIVQGQKGTPGELHGDVYGSKEILGDIRINNDFGIFGELLGKPKTNTVMPVGSQASVHTGKAQILATLDDQGVKAYDVEISRVTRQGVPQTKSMVITVKDPELLARTGGIVQGMSGSPIVQDGYIVGAVTHVFINDPTRGYGVFIQWMIEQSNSLSKNADFARTKQQAAS